MHLALGGRQQMIPPPNYALERSVTGWRVGAAGARKILAPAAPGQALPRPAQRKR